jgi:hypothetical protein
MPENKTPLVTKENTREIQEETSVVVPYLFIESGSRISSESGSGSGVLMTKHCKKYS